MKGSVAPVGPRKPRNGFTTASTAGAIAGFGRASLRPSRRGRNCRMISASTAPPCVRIARCLKRVAFNWIQTFNFHTEAAIALANAFGVKSGFE